MPEPAADFVTARSADVATVAVVVAALFAAFESVELLDTVAVFDNDPAA